MVIHYWLLVKYGGVAQLGEHLPCKQGVDSSILFISTNREPRRQYAKFSSRISSLATRDRD